MFVFNTTIETLFGSKLRARILGWFFLHSDERFYVRQLSRLLKEDLANLSRELRNLEKLSIISSSNQGSHKYYNVNGKNPIFPELKRLIIKTVGLVDILKNVLSKYKSKIKFAFIYGSFAKEKQSLNSDVDLMIVGEISFSEVTAIIEHVEKKIDREINPTVMDETEMMERLKNKNHFLLRVLKDPKIWLIGDERDIKRMG